MEKTGEGAAIHDQGFPLPAFRSSLRTFAFWICFELRYSVFLGPDIS